MTHVDLLLLAVVLEDDHGLAHGVRALGHDLLDAALELGWDHDLVLLEQIVLEGETNHITAGDNIADLEVSVRGVFPVLVLIEAGHIDTAGHEHRSGELSDGLEGSLNTIENCVQDAYPRKQ